MSPSKCPVCGGRQTIDPGFYRAADESGDDTTCRTCAGKGLVWPPTPTLTANGVGEYMVGLDWGVGQDRAAWSVGRMTPEGNMFVIDTGVTKETDLVVRINPNEGAHPERMAVLDYLATLPEDMPMMVLTPQSHAELDAAEKFRDRAREYNRDSVWAKGTESKLGRMNDYGWNPATVGPGYRKHRDDMPPEVSPRLAGLPVTEGDE